MFSFALLSFLNYFSFAPIVVLNHCFALCISPHHHLHCHVLSKESVEVEVYGAPIGSKHDNPLKFSKKETNEIVTMTEEEMYRINVENLENSLIQERIMSEENKIVMEDLGKQVH